MNLPERGRRRRWGRERRNRNAKLQAGSVPELFFGRTYLNWDPARSAELLFRKLETVVEWSRCNCLKENSIWATLDLFLYFSFNRGESLERSQIVFRGMKQAGSCVAPVEPEHTFPLLTRSCFCNGWTEQCMHWTTGRPFLWPFSHRFPLQGVLCLRLKLHIRTRQKNLPHTTHDTRHKSQRGSHAL